MNHASRSSYFIGWPWDRYSEERTEVWSSLHSRGRCQPSGIAADWSYLKRVLRRGTDLCSSIFREERRSFPGFLMIPERGRFLVLPGKRNPMTQTAGRVEGPRRFCG